MQEWAFVGRSEPISHVRGLIDDGRSVVIRGDAGSGKSRMLWELGQRIEESGFVPVRLVATATAASIPFAALAPLLTVEAHGLEPLDILALARSGLRERLATGRGVLLVDDVPRLDAGSATFVHQVVVDRLCAVIATARQGETGPDAVAALIGEPEVSVIDLAPLARDEIELLVEHVLGGQCGAGVVHRLGELSGGNPLLLRELIHHGRTAGWLAQSAGVWRVVDEVAAPPGLRELVESHLADLGPTVRAAMEILASAERIELDQISRLVGDDDLEQLEAHGLARIETAAGRTMVVLGHPLYGEAVRGALPVLRRRRIATDLASAVEEAGFPSPGAVMRVVQWRLDAGVDVDPALITHAAREAWMASDFPLAERLATTARERGAGFEAGLILGETAMFIGDHERAESVMGALWDTEMTDDERARLANARAFNLAQNLDREDDALAVIEDTLVRVGEGPHSDLLRGRAVTIHAMAPRPERALELAAPALDRPDDAEFHRIAFAASIALATLGRLDEAVKLGAAGYAAHAQLGDAARQIAESQHVGPILALVAAGRLEQAAELASTGRMRSAASLDAESQATFALLDGLVAMTAGRLADAVRSFREAAAINTDIGDHVALRWSLGGVCASAAMAGDRAAAASALSHLDTVPATSMQLLDALLVDRGRAWECVVRNDLAGAVAELRTAADRAASTGQVVAEALLVHDIVTIDARAGDAARLESVAARVDGELIPLLARHGRSLVDRDGDELERTAHDLDDLGVRIEAAIAASQAARELAGRGLDRRARAAEVFAATVLASCQGAAPPLRSERPAPVELTRREREVALLAAEGCSNKEIGERLYLSVRTIENHLQRAYEKLGVTSRAELAAALALAS